MPETTNLAAGALALLAGTGMATAVTAATLQSIDTGVYFDLGFHNPDISNFTTGFRRFEFEDPDGNTLLGELTTRSFFVFDISGLGSPVTAAILTLPQSNAACDGSTLESTGCYRSEDASETVAFYDVTTTLSDLTGGSGGTAAFDDLGSGTSYGSATVSGEADDPMPEVSVTLGAEAVADLNAAIGAGQSGFAIGAALSSIVDPGGLGAQELWAFSATDEPTQAQLVLHGPPQIPLPASLPLLAAVVGASGIVLRRRSA